MKDTIYLFDTHGDLPKAIIALRDSSNPPENASDAVYAVRSADAEKIFNLIKKMHVIYSECGPGTDGDIWTCQPPDMALSNILGACNAPKIVKADNSDGYIAVPVFKFEVIVDRISTEKQKDSLGSWAFHS